MKSKLILLLILFNLTLGYGQQLPEVDITLSELLLYNPALTSKKGGSALFVTRQLWNDNFNYSSYLASYNQPIYKDQIGIGATIYQEQTDFIQNTGMLLNGSYFFRLNEVTSIALGLGAEFQTLDVSIPDSYYIKDQNDPVLMAIDDQINYDFDVGIDVSHRELQVGAAYYRLTGNDRMPAVFRGYALYGFPSRLKRDRLDVGLLLSKYMDEQDWLISGFTQYWINSDIYLGLLYRSSKTANVLLGCVIKDRYHLGYSFENFMSANEPLSYHSLGIRFLLNEQYYDRLNKEDFMPRKSINIRK